MLAGHVPGYSSAILFCALQTEIRVYLPFTLGRMYGVDGNRSRCSPFWDDLLSCVQQVGRNDQWKKCQNYREDYFECLHHKKLYTRLEKIQKHKEKLIREGKWPPKEETPATQ